MADYLDHSLDDWLQHIQVQHWRLIELKLDRIESVWERLGGIRTPIVFTIAGTNGKGSCVAMIESVLRAGGLRTGSYTSPHLVQYNERVCIDGKPVSDQLLIDAFCQIERARAEIPLTYFEFGTLCALLIFQQQGVAASILETGMGGRLDAVNIIDNDLALITSIGLDHEQWLGSDREQIGAEKAGVFKPGGKAVCADPDPPASIARAARVVGATLLQVDQDFAWEPGRDPKQINWSGNAEQIPLNWQSIENLSPPFIGDHQRQNLSGCVAALAATQNLTGISLEQLHQGLATASLPARCQIISTRPMIILDVAHNADSADQLAHFLQGQMVDGNTYAVFGVLADKSLVPIVKNIAPHIDHWNCVTLEGDRGQSAADLEAALLSVIPTAKAAQFSNPVVGFRNAESRARKQDRIVIFGSFHTVGDIIGAREQDLAEN